jgi:ribosomal protein S14
MHRHRLYIYNDNMKRHLFLKTELKRALLRSIKKSQVIPLSRRYQASFYLTTLPHISSPTLYNNRCAFSGRNLAVNKQTQYSRFILRDEMVKSNIPGCRRAS